VARSYSQRDIKLLFALSRNRCAYPGCDNPIVADATEFDDAAVVGQIAHIVASSGRGPRGDPTFPPEQLDREPNLLLLCGHHHALVDAQDATYTVEQLRAWKREHVAAQPRAAGGAGMAALPVPDQVPAAPRGFVNRDAELALLDDLTTVGDEGDGPAVVVVTGAHGVGKTAISRYWAHRSRSRFADGQLHADLGDLRHRGGVAVGDLLGGFLTAIGLPEEVIPARLEQREALFRSTTAGKRVLLVLDDVENAAEVTPLLPNANGSVVVLTGREPLLELLHDRARPMHVGRLEPKDAETLLRLMIGRDRVRADPAAVAELTGLCDGLPVALRVCGARLEVNTQRPVRWLVEQLVDEASRLEQIAWGPRKSLDVVFGDAYQALELDARLVYRRLGAQPARRFTAGVAAAAAGITAGQASWLLERLMTTQLLEDIGERYRFHDLLHIHSERCARLDDAPEELEAATRRVVGFYLHAARVADVAITPTRLRVGPVPAGYVDGLPQFRSGAEAFAWFELERPNVLAALRAAFDRELYGEVWRICESLWPCYFNRKPYAEWIEAHELGVVAANRTGDAAAESTMRRSLAKALTETGDHDRAEQELTTAGRLAERAGNPVLAASVLDFRGHLDLDRRRFADARAAYEGAREAFEALGVSRGVALEWYHAGRAIAGLGDHAAAARSYRSALDLIDPAADELLLGRTLIHLGEAEFELGDVAAARVAADRALAIMTANGLRYYEARALEVLAAIAAADGDARLAAERWTRAHALYGAIGSRRREDVALRVSRPD
jgi:tetratricopeptide (TPR) repeat protein